MTIVDSRPTGPAPSRPAGVPPPPPPQPNRPPVRPAQPTQTAAHARPKWAVACLIAAAVLTVAALLFWDIVTVPWAVVGGR